MKRLLQVVIDTNIVFEGVTVSQKTITEQRASYSALLQSLGEASDNEITQVLNDRETIETEDELSKTVINKVQKQIAQKKALLSTQSLPHPAPTTSHNA